MMHSRDALDSQVWGCMIDGKAGLIRGSLKRAAPLAQIILQVLEIGAVAGGLLEVIAGGLISLFILRRRLLSLLSEVLEVMKLRERDEAFCLGPALREELVLCVGLLPLAVVDCRLSTTTTCSQLMLRAMQRLVSAAPLVAHCRKRSAGMRSARGRGQSCCRQLVQERGRMEFLK